MYPTFRAIPDRSQFAKRMKETLYWQEVRATAGLSHDFLNSVIANEFLALGDEFPVEAVGWMEIVLIGGGHLTSGFVIGHSAESGSHAREGDGRNFSVRMNIVTMNGNKRRPGSAVNVVGAMVPASAISSCRPGYTQDSLLSLRFRIRSPNRRRGYVRSRPRQ